jgi:hypothetical protein
MGLYKQPSPAGQKLRSLAVESPHNGRCGYGTHKTCFKTRGQRSNTVWIFAVPTGVPTKQSTEVRITQEPSYFLKAQIARLHNEQVSRYLLGNYNPETLYDPSYYSR